MKTNLDKIKGAVAGHAGLIVRGWLGTHVIASTDAGREVPLLVVKGWTGKALADALVAMGGERV